MRVNIREAVQGSPLKGDQNSAQGFNPGLGNSWRCALTRRHVNDALSELHPRSGLQVLKGRKLSWIILVCRRFGPTSEMKEAATDLREPG